MIAKINKWAEFLLRPDVYAIFSMICMGLLFVAGIALAIFVNEEMFSKMMVIMFAMLTWQAPILA